MFGHLQVSPCLVRVEKLARRFPVPQIVPQRDLVRNPGVSEVFELVLELFPVESAVRFKPSGVRICGCSPERDELCMVVSPLIYCSL